MQQNLKHGSTGMWKKCFILEHGTQRQNHRMQVHRTGRTGTGTHLWCLKWLLHLDTEASTLFEVLDSCTNFSATTSLFLRYKLKKVVHVAVELNSSITAFYLLSHILPVLNPSFSSSLLSYVPPFLCPSFPASLLSCIPPALHSTSPAFNLSSILPILLH